MSIVSAMWQKIPSTKVTAMQWMNREKVRSEVLAGTFLNLGCAATVEIAADLGFDWLLLDLEHGMGSLADLPGMLTACRGSLAAPIVRIRSVDADTVKFVMDSGAAGIMFPFVNSASEARRAVQYMKYPPQGTRGVAGTIRATAYGREWNQYFREANDNSLVVVQIETTQAVEAAEQIASVEDVDVLFVGPLDLSVSLGCPGDFTTPVFIDAAERVIAACEKHGKSAGILSRPPLDSATQETRFPFPCLGYRCRLGGCRSTAESQRDTLTTDNHAVHLG